MLNVAAAGFIITGLQALCLALPTFGSRRGQPRDCPADVIGNAVQVMRIATGEE